MCVSLHIIILLLPNIKPSINTLRIISKDSRKIILISFVALDARGVCTVVLQAPLAVRVWCFHVMLQIYIKLYTIQ